MTENEPAGIVALAADPQQILVQTQRQIHFAAVHVIARLPIGNVKVLRWETELLPQLARASIGRSSFRCRLAFDKPQHGTQGAPKSELPALTFGGVG